MSQWKRISLGSKRRSDWTNTDQQGHPLTYPPNFHSSQSSEESSSHPGSLDDRSLHSDPHSRFAFQSHRTSEATLTHLEAPLQAPSIPFTLPSLSLANPVNYTLPPIPQQSPRASRLGALAYDQGPNDLPIQILQREDAKLVSANSSAQIRIAELDEELRLSQVNIAKLVKERQRLEAKINLLEAEIDELRKNIEASQQHTAAKDVQYSQILELSTKLQTQGEAENQQCRTDRERWAQDKQHMERLVTLLRAEIWQLRNNTQRSIASERPHIDGSGLPEADPTFTDQAELAAPSSALKYGDIITKDTLISIRNQHTELMNLIEKSEIIGRNIQACMQGMDAHYSLPQERGG